MKRKLLLVVSNFCATLVLFSLIAAPVYFAKNFSQVAGVKTETPYLIISQISKFPNLNLTQSGNTFNIEINKQGPSQLFLSVLIINNPTNTTKTYSIKNISPSTKVFFGEDYKNSITNISLEPQLSVPVSVFSQSAETSQTVSFEIKTD